MIDTLRNWIKEKWFVCLSVCNIPTDDTNARTLKYWTRVYWHKSLLLLLATTKRATWKPNVWKEPVFIVCSNPRPSLNLDHALSEATLIYWLPSAREVNFINNLKSLRFDIVIQSRISILAFGPCWPNDSWQTMTVQVTTNTQVVKKASVGSYKMTQTWIILTSAERAIELDSNN